LTVRLLEPASKLHDHLGDRYLRRAVTGASTACGAYVDDILRIVQPGVERREDRADSPDVRVTEYVTAD
jgi:hypothetical protein